MADIIDPFKAQATSGIKDPFQAASAAPAAAAPEPPKPKLTRSWGEVATDTLSGVAKGAVDIAKSAHQITSLANPANIARGAASKLSRAAFGRDLVPTESEALSTVASTVSRLAGGGDVEVPSRSDMLGSATDALERSQSPILQRKKQELADTKGFLASAKKVVTDPVLLGNFAAEQVPNLVGMGIGTAASGAGAAARAGAPVLQRALAGGATREAAQALASKASAEAGKQAAERFVLGSNTVFEAGSAADQAYRDVLSQPDEVWQANQEFQRELAAGTPAARIKERMAREAGARAAGITAPIAAVAGRLVAPFEADVFAGRLARTPAAIAGGAAREATEEAIQEGGSQLAGNLAMQDVDPTRGLLEGVPEAAGTGAALGGVLGAGLAGAGAAANTGASARRAAEPPPLPEPSLRRPVLALPAPTVAVDSQGQATTPGQADAQMRQDAASVQAREELGLTPDVNRARREHPGAAPNAASLARPSVPFPDAPPGSLSDIANLVADVQVVQTAGAAQPAAPAKSKERSSGVGEAPTAADAVPPGFAPRWVDLSTGEVREPTLDEIKAEIHQAANYMVDNGTGVWRPAIARALGLKSRQFDAAWNEVVRERKQGLTAPAPSQESNDGITAADAADPAPAIAPADQPEAAGVLEAAPEATGAADTAAVPAPGRAVDQESLPAAQEPAGDDAQAGVRAPEAVAPAPAAAAPEGAVAPTYDESDEVLETDITPPSGGPFTQRGAADAQAGRHEGGRVFEVDGGFVVRTPTTSAAASSGQNPETTQAALPDSEPAPAAGEQAPLQSSPQVADSAADQTGSTEASGEPASVGPASQQAPASPEASAPTPRQAPAAETPVASRSGADAVPSAQATPATTGPQPMVRVRGGKPYYDATHRKTLQAYFQPGRDVESFGGGRDRVLEFRDNDGTGRWAVRVQAIDQDGNPAIENGAPAQPRWHSTVPMDRALRAVFGAPQKKARAAGKKATPAADPPDLRNSSNPSAVAPAAAPVATAAADAATSPTNNRPEPTDAQKEAGNYKKGHIRINGHDISIENPAGSKRRPEWPALKNHYGYFKGTIGKDKDHVDVFMTERAHDPNLPVFVVDQVNHDGTFDEHKVIMGSPSEAAARRAYLSNYSRGWTGLGAITQFSQEDFKAWLRDPKKTKRPAGKLAKPAAAANAADATGAKADKPAKAGITDSGEQLRNNNRNRYGGIQWSDVEGLNDTAKVKAVTRDAIWPQPDWAAIAKEEGVVPWRVLVAKRVRSMVGKAPATRGAPSDAELQAYLEAVSKVREATETYMRNPAAGAEAGGLGQAVLSHLIPKISAARGVAAWSQNPDEALLVRLIGGNRFLRAVQRERVQTEAMAEVASSGWPNAEPAAKQEAWQRRFRIVHSDNLAGYRDARVGDDRYGYYVVQGAKPSAYARKLAGPFVTEDQAIDKARELAKPQRQGDAGGIALGDVVREGAARRDGDATPDQLREVFGFRGVNFGNWVNQAERQAHLNHAYDAFADLAELLDIPPRAISLNGLLGVAFGAQGKGRAAAHFVPGDNEINITKTAGAGALAHEWGHALDHYFAVQSGKSAARARRPYMTELLSNAGPNVRPEVVAAFRDVVETMQNRPLTDEQRAAETSAARLRHAATSDFHRASRALDSTRQKPYWSTPWEMFARALESWALNRLAEQDRRSDYLVKPNLEDDAWKGAYPLGDDVKRIGAAFDRLFATIQNEPTADGNVRLFSRGDDQRGIDFDRALRLKQELTANWGDRAPNVVMIQNAEAFPDSAKVDPEYRRGEGFFNGRDTVWINVERIPTEERLRQVLAHEALGHYGVEQVVGQAQWDGIVRAITALETSGKASAQTQAVFADVRRRYGAVDATTFAKEAIAVMAERGIRNTFVQRVVAAVNRFLRNLMPNRAWSEGDIRDLLSAADSFLRAGRDLAQRQADTQAYAFSRPDAEGSVAGDGQRSIRMGGETFVERSGTFYLVNGTGHPKDFTVFSQALDAAASTGGEVRLDDAIEGQRPTYSVVVPEVVARGAFIGRGSFSLPPRPAGPTFAEQVRARLEAKDPRGPVLQLGRTPAVLRMLGMPDLPLTMPTAVLFKIATGKGGQRAPLTERQIVKMPELLDDPVAITDSNTEDAALVVVTRAKDAGGNPILVSVAAERSAQGNPALKVNIVTSAYGKENTGWLDRERAAGRLRYAENESAPDRQVSTDAALNLRVEPDGQRPENPASSQSGQAQGQAEAAGQGPGRKVLSAADLRNFRAAQRAQSFSGPGLFSKAPADIVADIEAVSNPGRDQGALERAKAWLADVTPKKLKDQTRGAWLGALTTRHLTELGGDYFQNIKHYSDFLSQMQADRNTLQAEGEAIAEAARKWASKNPAAARALFDLMHDATIDGVDPAEAYQPLQFRFGGELHEATPKKVKEAIAAVRQQMRERSAENKTDLMNEVKVLRGLPARERARAAKYPTLVDRWNQLPAEAQEHYRAFRDLYKKRSGQVEQALIDRINDTDAPEQHKRRIIDVIRRQFESNRLQGVYFPLQRFGRYFVAAEKADTPTFLMFERLNDLERAVRDLKARGFTIKAQGLKQAGKAQDAPSGTFVAEVIGALKNAHVSEATQDQIYQLYLQSLPEMSMRKHQIHRQSVPGWDPDAVRAFAYNTHHGAHQLARMRYSHKLQAVLDLLKQQQDTARKEAGADTRKIAAGDAILEELNRRHEWIMNPTDSQLTNLISSAGFVYYLGATPAAALVNLTQTALVSYPFLAARYGGIKAMNALLSASRDAVRTVGNIQRTLKDPEEQAAHKALMASGALDKTQAHNLAGIAEGGLQGYNPAWARAMEVIGWGFHKTEVVNREATGLAAFRLARAGGATFNEAVKFAHDAIFDTHFDYSNANRARFMQSGAAKVLLMFRQYSLNMTWMLGRSVWLAARGESPEVKRIARRQLAGILGMSAVFSGTLGLPMAGVVSGVLNALQATFGDDDEPWDAETEFGAFLADMLGPTAAQVVLHGAANQVTGADIAGRVGLSDLWFRDADRELEGRGLYYNLLEQAAGPMGGVLKNAIVGKNMIDQGHTWRGVETMLPKALKDMLKGARYAAEGVNTLRGDALLEDKSLGDVLLQVGGFSPARVAERYDRNRALTNYEDHIMRRRQHLMDSFAMALRLGDDEARAATLSKIQGFNRANPEVAITTASIRRSIASRARYSAKAEGGIVLNPKLAARLKATVGE